MLGRAHQLEPHIFFRQVVDRAVAGLLDAQRGLAVGYRNAREDDLDPAAFRQEIDAVIRAAEEAGGRIGHVRFLHMIINADAA